MKYRILALVMLIASSHIAFGAVIDLDEKDIVNNTITKDDRTYRIVYSTETYFNGNILKRIFVENLDEVNVLEAIERNLSLETAYQNSRAEELENRIAELKVNIVKNSDMLVLMELQRNATSQALAELQAEIDELNSLITSNILISPSTYNIAIIVFIILVIVVLILRGRKFFKPERSKKEPKKKGDLELVAEEIKKKPEGRVEIDY